MNAVELATRCAGLRRHPAARGHRVAAALTTLLLLLGPTACSSNRGSSDQGHASVLIKGHPAEQVRLVAKQVFNEQGYVLQTSLPDEMVFQRPGGGGSALLYGGWDGSGVVQRIRVHFYSAGEVSVNVVATVFAVRNAGDRVMEEESRKLVLSRGPYKKMLAEIQRRMTTP
jgi:hypothetical protein